MDVILTSGIFLSFFIAFLLLTKKHKALNDKILVVWMVIIGIHLLGYYFNQGGYWEIYPHLIGVTAPFPLLHGPMLFLYTHYSLYNARKLKGVDYLHFAPAFGAYMYMFNFFFFYSTHEKTMVDTGEIQDFNVFALVLLIACLVSGLTYAVLSYRLTTRHEHQLNDNFSHQEGISIRWLRNCIISIGLVFLSATIIIAARDFFDLHLPFNGDYIIYLIIIGFVFYIGYFGIKQENIFINNSPLVSPEVKETENTEKYRNSGMKSEFSRELYQKLMKIMSEEKPYLDPRLSLARLAAMLEVSPNQLSQVINQEARVNFHDFVNNYRVEEFIYRAGENKNYSLLALAFDSGFNSKSSFNNIFKKQKGLSPSAYLSKQVQKDKTGQ